MKKKNFLKHKAMSNAAGNVFKNSCFSTQSTRAIYINKKITKSLTPKASRPQDSIKLKKKKISQEN